MRAAHLQRGLEADQAWTIATSSWPVPGRESLLRRRAGRLPGRDGGVCVYSVPFLQSANTTFTRPRATLINPRPRFFFPPPELCTDNAAMIAAAGFKRYQMDGPSDWSVNAVPYLKLV